MKIYDLTPGGTTTYPAGPYAEGEVMLGWDPSGLQFVKIKTDSAGQVFIANPAGGGGTSTVIGVSADNSADTTTKLPTLPAVVSTGTPAWTNGNQVPLTVDASGNLFVNVKAGGAGGGIAQTQIFGTNGTWTNVGPGTNATLMPVTFAGTSTVAGTVTTTPSGTQPVSQITSPWIVGGTTTTVPSGTQSVAQTGSPWGVSGTVTSSQGGAPWTYRLQDGVAGTLATVTSANALKVDNSGVTQPVSGTTTTVPSGTQTIAGAVTVTGTTTIIPSGTQPVSQVTSPWVVGGTTTTVPSGTQSVAQTGSPWGVSGTVTITPSGTQTVTDSSRKSATASAPAQIAVGTATATILAANAARKKFIIQNTGVTTIKLAFGGTPTATAYTMALAAGAAADDASGGFYTDDMYTGVIIGISSLAGGTVVITELT